MRRFLSLLATCFQPSPKAVPHLSAETSDFIRVREGTEATRLETAVTHFEKDGLSLDLIAAIHIADHAYYQSLNQRFTRYDAVLFEGVGGSTPLTAFQYSSQDDWEPSISPPEQTVEAHEEGPMPETVESAIPPPRPRDRPLKGLHRIYGKGADWLGLAYQMEQVDYQQPNFVHADVSMGEFRQLQRSRKETILGFLLKAGRGSPKNENEPGIFSLLKALVTGNRKALKLQLIHSLGAGDEQMARFEDESVIVTDRNLKCLEVLRRQVAEGKTTLAIFYGAAHFPDIEARLVQDGWQKTGEEWIVAWELKP